ncbi:MAG TPA: Mpo1-like protein [Aliidongia sp.]|uniref:Mpo1 family 2-hydroxy fatty acid dioxygenase n=1 Tax=Aliidongia sp. TaxID=1914230 RepID=UPI002DDD5D39|nr:Mpo1-like protein [Aliidongia sp.]HEV2674592.1 Mpo1-like protein [Aliidongia sp.]
MKTLAEHMAFYGCYHRDLRNRLTHFVGVPTIIFAALIPLSFATVAIGPVGVTPALIVAVVLTLYYIKLDLAIGLAMAILFVPLVWAAGSIAALGTAPALEIFAGLFVAGWIVQLIGHWFEGNKPALLSNLFQTVVSPIFLTAELFFALGLKRGLQEEVERRIVMRDFPGAEMTLKGARHA